MYLVTQVLGWGQVEVVVEHAVLVLILLVQVQTVSF
jgi:hypothetical protein